MGANDDGDKLPETHRPSCTCICCTRFLGAPTVGERAIDRLERAIETEIERGTLKLGRSRARRLATAVVSEYVRELEPVAMGSSFDGGRRLARAQCAAVRFLGGDDAEALNVANWGRSCIISAESEARS